MYMPLFFAQQDSHFSRSHMNMDPVATFDLAYRVSFASFSPS